MLMNDIQKQAMPYLKGRAIQDLVVGVSLIAVQLDDGSIGVSYVLRESLPGGCSVFPYAREAVGMSAEEAGLWAAEGREDLQRAIGNAVLNAAAQQQELTDCGGKDEPFGLRLKGGETVGMVGMIAPAIHMLKPWDCKFLIFDKGREGQEGICPAEKQPELLPECDIVFLSGTTTINGTADSLLGWCRKDCRIVMIGSSTPMYPAAFADTNVRILAGAWGRKDKKEEIFRLISLGSGMDALRGCMVKKNVAIFKF